MLRAYDSYQIKFIEVFFFPSSSLTSSRDGTLITSKQRSTHLQAYDDHLPLITYDLDIINMQIILAYILHTWHAYTVCRLFKIWANYQKQSLIIELMFLALLDIDLHYNLISKGFIYGGYSSTSAIKHQLFIRN